MNELAAAIDFIVANWRPLFFLAGWALLSLIGCLWAWGDL